MKKKEERFFFVFKPLFIKTKLQTIIRKIYTYRNILNNNNKSSNIRSKQKNHIQLGRRQI